ncbi:hypothetical protein RhiirA1_457199 [Rhizophagus irregularis]|uniref:Protein kinase domain-containing protein n=1 Tax=Rhizophagus irregularis TaxID=588596 RepID=A0A2N0RYU5_9GLOM|nr:hypothetical protein RhiirA1_457199 [Rhizophagus irregularis]
MSTKQKELTNFQRGEIIGAWKCGTSIKKISEVLYYSQSIIYDVIAAYEDYNLERPCENCEIILSSYKWCEPCQIIQMQKLISGNKKIDDFIDQILILNVHVDNIIVFEWISYNQFDNIKELYNGNFVKIYSAIWKDGPLHYNFRDMKGKRESNKKVTLKCLYDSQNMINDFLNKAKSYVINESNLNLKLYGISQNPDTNDYIMVLQDEYYGKYEIMEDEWCKLYKMNYLKVNFTVWLSDDEIIDDFIQKMELKINKSSDIRFEWIPYNQFINIKEVGKGYFTKVYSAIWKNGPLHYDFKNMKGTRESNKNVTIKCFDNSQYMIDEFLDMVKTCPFNRINGILGISQNPFTKDYAVVHHGEYCEKCGQEYTILIYKWCKPCRINDLKANFVNWTSGNEEIDNFIQEMQLNLDHIFNSSLFQWIPYNEFYDIKEKKDDFYTVYSAIWKNGPLNYNFKDLNMVTMRDSNERVTLKYFYDIQSMINEYHSKDNFINIYGISRDLNTKDYIMVFQDDHCGKCGKEYTKAKYRWCNPCQTNYLKMNFTNWTSGNKKIDDFIQEKQLKCEYIFNSSLIFQWIPYDNFNDIKEIAKSDFDTVNSAIMEMDLLHYSYDRKVLKLVALKHIHDSQNMIDNFLKEVESYSMNIIDPLVGRFKIYGISQDPSTKDFIMVLRDKYCEKCGKQYEEMVYEWCKSCQINDLKTNFTNWTSENEPIDYFIQGMQLRIVHSLNIIFEWIPYNQFYDIKKTGKSDLSKLQLDMEIVDLSLDPDIAELAVWKDGPLNYNKSKRELMRKPNTKVALKYLQDITKLLNEITNYSVDGSEDNELKVYGISQNPDTKDYILVLQNEYCEICYEQYDRINIKDEWCQFCQTNYLKTDFKNWTSKNKVIDDFIQEVQLKIYNPDQIIEWIPYNQFNDIEELNKSNTYTMYSAIWKDGPLCYKMEWLREQNKKVILKCMHNSQNMINEFLYKVSKAQLIKITCGVSQNPDTNDYIMVFRDGYCEKCGEEFTSLMYKWCKPCRINDLKVNLNWFCGNEKIDNFIQEIQLEFNYIFSTPYSLFQWIPYNEFYNINEIKRNDFDDFDKIYSAVYFEKQKENLLHYGYKEVLRKVTLKYLHNSQNMIDEFLTMVKNNIISNSFKTCGISQNPDTKDYIMVLEDNICKKCGTQYGYICNSCQVNDLKVNLTSNSRFIDDFVQEIQSKINKSSDIIFERVPYNQFYNINKIGNDLNIAIWRNGPLYYDTNTGKSIRKLYKKVALKYFNNSSQDMNKLDEVIKHYNNMDNNSLEVYGISQNPFTKECFIIFQDGFCEKCNEQYADIENKWCKKCQISNLKENFTRWTSGNKQIDALVQEIQVKVNKSSDIIFEWIPYDQFNDIKEIGEGGFAKVYSAKWIHSEIVELDEDDTFSINKATDKMVALKCLYNSQNITNEFLNEIRAYSIDNSFLTSNILKIYGISQNPDTEEYIIVLHYAGGEIHQNQMVHHDFHPGNILFKDNVSTYVYSISGICISDMGLCGEVGSMSNESKLFGVMPYMAPEVLRGEPYTQAADIYSFGMIMYFIATGRQPFSNCVHDHYLALDICKDGIRPTINELEAPKCYIDLMKKCWDTNPDNRLNAIEIQEIIKMFKEQKHYEIERQFKEAEEYREVEEYRKANLTLDESNQLTTHSQAIYVSRLLNTECYDDCIIKD